MNKQLLKVNFYVSSLSLMRLLDKSTPNKQKYKRSYNDKFSAKTLRKPCLTANKQGMVFKKSLVSIFVPKVFFSILLLTINSSMFLKSCGS